MLLTAFFVAMISGCKKKTVLRPSDDILYTQLTPHPQITAVDSIVTYGAPFMPYNAFCPSDTLATYPLDLNNDGTVDFEVRCKSWYHMVSASGPSANYNSSISLVGTIYENQVASDPVTLYTSAFSPGDTVDSTYSWAYSAYLRITSVYWNNPSYTGDNYFGVRMENSGNKLYGWVYVNITGFVITIKSFALNRTPENSILAGQTQ